jgi:predicted RNA binding protein YcfA (HicA-like mRNA interferase family)
MKQIKEMKTREVIKILRKFGFKFVSRGRHDKYVNEEKNITVPVPASHDYVTKGVIQSLIRQTGIPREEFEV